MSVEIEIYIVDWSQVTNRLQEGMNPFEEEIFEGLESMELSYTSFKGQMFFLDQYELVAPDLMPSTREKIDEFLNTIFWSWREDTGKQIMEMNFELDELDTALNPETTKHFANLWRSISLDELHRAFTAKGIPDAGEWMDYLSEYGSALDRAAAENKGFIALVYG